MYYLFTLHFFVAIVDIFMRLIIFKIIIYSTNSLLHYARRQPLKLTNISQIACINGVILTQLSLNFKYFVKMLHFPTTRVPHILQLFYTLIVNPYRINFLYRHERTSRTHLYRTTACFVKQRSLPLSYIGCNLFAKLFMQNSVTAT